MFDIIIRGPCRCNPLLAAARACENHTYIVGSTYTDAAAGWVTSSILGHDGSTLAQAFEFGEVAVAEVDLAVPMAWRGNLGDFRATVQRHRMVDADAAVDGPPSAAGVSERTASRVLS